MGWISKDFKCRECDHVWEDLYKRGEPPTTCPECGSEYIGALLSAPALATFSMSTPAAKESILRARSEAHTKKLVKKEAEKWGELGKERAREGVIQVGSSGKKKEKKRK